MEHKLKKQLYEGMYILSPSLSDDAIKKALSRITDSIEEKGGEIKKIHDQGRKKLAYQMEGNRQGYYCIVYFDAPATAVEEMWREYHLNEDLLRFITLRTDEVMEEIRFKSLSQ